MDLSLELLAIQNPWWRGAGKHPANLKFDPVIVQYEKNKLKWQPEVLRQLDLNRDAVYLLNGPKGAGKTTILKLIVRQLIKESKTGPNQIFYYSCRNLVSFEQLNEMVKLFLNNRSSKRRAYILIDEIIMLKHWRRGIDYLRRAKKFNKVTVILTGSFRSEETSERDSKIINLSLNSLAFAEFLELVNPGLFKKIKAGNYTGWGKKIEYYLDIYLLTGGNLGALNDYQEHGAIRQGWYSNNLHWLESFMASQGRDTVLMKQIMEKIILNLGRPVGYQTLAKKTKAKTHLTAAEYLNLLENAFALKTVYQLGDGSAAKSKAKKIYFQDPFLFWLFYCYVHGSLDYWQLARERLHDQEIFSHLLENAVFSHLIKDEKNKPTRPDRCAGKITYWRDNIKKQEIDFLVERGKIITPVLIRYDKEIKEKDLEIFKQAGFSRGIIISKDVLKNSGKVKIMPLSYFLMFYKKLI